MHLLSRLAAPAVSVLRVSTDGVVRLRGTHEATVTEDEVRALIGERTRTRVFVPQERKMIEGMRRLADRPVRVIMTPRPEVAWLDVRASAQSIREALDRSQCSRKAHPRASGATRCGDGRVRMRQNKTRTSSPGGPAMAEFPRSLIAFQRQFPDEAACAAWLALDDPPPGRRWCARRSRSPSRSAPAAAAPPGIAELSASGWRPLMRGR
jgi:hypothetical protein